MRCGAAHDPAGFTHPFTAQRQGLMQITTRRVSERNVCLDSSLARRNVTNKRISTNFLPIG
jgi:hypothetical protein